MPILFFLISFGASIIGGICGIGGGVIIKPVLDLFGAASVATIGFLSSCTVLCMSLYNVSKSLTDKGSSSAIDLHTGTPLAIGAAIGGILGNKAFVLLRSMAPREGIAGAAQSLCLMVLVLGTLLYTLKKSAIHPKNVQGFLPCSLIGLALGALSSFLGIGGGPFNLVVLHFFFGMETKKAAANSLYVILFSQIANLLSTLLTASVPPFEVPMLVLMALGGIGGGIVGRKLNKRMDNTMVDRLFVGLMVVIILICVYNAWRYTVV